MSKTAVKYGVLVASMATLLLLAIVIPGQGTKAAPAWPPLVLTGTPTEPVPPSPTVPSVTPTVPSATPTEPGPTATPTDPGPTASPTDPGPTASPTEPGPTEPVPSPTEPGPTATPTDPGPTATPTDPGPTEPVPSPTTTATSEPEPTATQTPRPPRRDRDDDDDDEERSDPAIGITANRTEARVGDLVEFTVAVTNYGPDIARNVVFTDTLPLSLALYNVEPNPGLVSFNTQVVTVTVGDLMPSEVVLTRITTLVQAPAEPPAVTNTVVLHPGGEGNVPENDAASFVVTILGNAAPAPAPAPAPGPGRAPVTFPETGFSLGGEFLTYWETHGGLPVFGFPIAPEQETDGRATQWLERARFELHTENTAPYNVLLSRLGVDTLQQQGRDWESFPKADPSAAHYFSETGHAVTHEPFWAYWSSHGLEFDGQPGTSMAESLALFGLPISEPMMETNANGDEVLTQWFERARFEYHPNNPAEYQVLLGLLGSDMKNMSGE